MMEFKNLKVDISGGVALVTINRPAAMNALNSAFFNEFNDLLNIIGKDDTIRIMVITGEGKAFVAGADIAEMANMNFDQACSFSHLGQKTFLRLEKMEMPVIAAVNGFALGGGFELAMACDFRIASSSAKFGQPEVSLGLIPGYAGTQRLSRLGGMGNALYLILTGEMISADDALHMGLIQKIFPPETLMDEVMKIARKMASNGSHAIRKAKEVIRKGREISLKEGSQMESEAFSKLFDYPSTKEGMAAFLEKRKPIW
jgi:enoyl-CoA hydratase